uniref:Uncharacterized protein n=1 Tax=Aegilops tauschii subsp. strangulata TaxID=200361 RepID=A0A452YYB0_AEGTS
MWRLPPLLRRPVFVVAGGATPLPPPRLTGAATYIPNAPTFPLLLDLAGAQRHHSETGSRGAALVIGPEQGSGASSSWPRRRQRELRAQPRSDSHHRYPRAAVLRRRWHHALPPLLLPDPAAAQHRHAEAGRAPPGLDAPPCYCSHSRWPRPEASSSPSCHRQPLLSPSSSRAPSSDAREPR